MNRKDFFTAAGVIPFASNWLFANRQLEAKPTMKLIDTHQHLYDTRRFPSNWGQLPVEGNFGVEEYIQATQGLGIEKAVYMEVGVPKNRKFEEAQYAIELCADNHNPTVAAVISYDIHDSNFSSFIKQFKGSRYIKGIRASFRSVDDFADKTVTRNAQLLGTLGMSLDFSISPRWLGAVQALIRSCPDTRFLVNHCANADPKAFLPRGSVSGYPDHSPEQWIRDINAVAEMKNVVCKISGVATRSPGYLFSAATLGPVINHCLEIFGPDRVMFASDWPWCLRGIEVSRWVSILKEVVGSKPRLEQEKLFYRNAELFYNI